MTFVSDTIKGEGDMTIIYNIDIRYFITLYNNLLRMCQLFINFQGNFSQFIYTKISKKRHKPKNMQIWLLFKLLIERIR